MNLKSSFLSFSFFFFFSATAQHFTLLKPKQVFDGEQMHPGWVVLVKDDTIVAAGAMNFSLPAGTKVVELQNATLLPGLIEGHSHLFLHPYNETSWDEQVLHESRAERTARAVTHAATTLRAGFTTVRDLGTEGAGYDDVGLRQAIEKNIIPGPRMLIATRAIVAKGFYGPRSDNPDLDLPKGAEEVSGPESIAAAVRTQIGNGADIIKVYADYRLGANQKTMPAFSEEELSLITSLAHSSGKMVVAHASSEEGMRRAIAAGVNTIEHGDNGTPEIFKLMQAKNIALCPTLAAGDAVLQYRGWKKDTEPEPARITNKRKTFRAALDAGVTICMGGDVGVFAHGDNAREMEMMVSYGMNAMAVLKAATSVNADVFGLNASVGRIKKGLLADIIAVEGDPTVNIANVRKVMMVMKNGEIISH